jgi:Flp pilus assembly protein TadB
MSDNTSPYADPSSRVESARADLESTLDAIEDRLNVPKRFEELTGKAKSSYEKNPVPWIIGATAAAIVVVGVVAWAVLSGDDD